MARHPFLFVSCLTIGLALPPVRAAAADWPEWRRMRCALWPDSSSEDDLEMRSWCARNDHAIDRMDD